MRPASCCPFAGVIHVGLSPLEQSAVAAEGIEALRIEHVGTGVQIGSFAGIDPLDVEAFAREQAFRVGDQLRQPLERGGVLHDQRFHGQVLRSHLRITNFVPHPGSLRSPTLPRFAGRDEPPGRGARINKASRSL